MEKSFVKDFTQTIIGKYLCAGSRAEIAGKGYGGKKQKTGYNAKQVVLRQHAKRAICKTDGCKWKPNFGACKEAARRRRKENGTARKRIKRLEHGYK
jgi:hypothetical protein